MKCKMTEQDIHTLIKLWNNRIPIAKIIQLLPYKQFTITNMIKTLKDNGTLLEENRIAPKKDKIVSMYMNGEKDVARLAEIFEVSIPRIRQCLWSNGIYVERRKHYTPKKMSDKKQAIIAELKSGKKQAQVARDYNCSRPYINQLYKKYVQNKEN